MRRGPFLRATHPLGEIQAVRVKPVFRHVVAVFGGGRHHVRVRVSTVGQSGLVLSVVQEIPVRKPVLVGGVQSVGIYGRVYRGREGAVTVRPIQVRLEPVAVRPVRVQKLCRFELGRRCRFVSVERRVGWGVAGNSVDDAASSGGGGPSFPLLSVLSALFGLAALLLALGGLGLGAKLLVPEAEAGAHVEVEERVGQLEFVASLREQVLTLVIPGKGADSTWC